MESSTGEQQSAQSTQGGAGRVARCGVLGALPGLVVVGGAVLLHTTDVITADQSQIGFLGVPMLFVGLVTGLLVGAESAGLTLRVLGGILIGFVAGALASAALVGLSTSMPFFAFIVPGAMFAGGTLAALQGAS